MPSRTDQREINAPVEVVFDLCRSIDFHVEAGRSIKAKAVGGKTSGFSERGSETVYSAAYFGLRFRLTMVVTAMDAPHEFKEEMSAGLFQSFSHHYRIKPIRNEEGCLLEDTFSFQSPLGPVGALFDSLLLKRALFRAQDERLDAIQETANR